MERQESTFEMRDPDGVVRVFRLVPFVTVEDYVDMAAEAQAAVVRSGMRYNTGLMPRSAKDKFLRLRQRAG